MKETSEEAKERAANYMSLKGALEPKQETLEEAAKEYSGIAYDRNDYEEKYYNLQGCTKYDSFIEGAKWQQEQILQFLYSEITERRPYSSSKMCEKVIEFIEQFKKK